jgi:hypothetical protein
VKHYVAAFLTVGLVASAVAWAQYAPAGGQPIPLTPKVEQRVFTVTGTVVSVRSDTLVVRIDDHQHRITFALGPQVSPAALKAGARVSVRYHPTGATGQAADAVEALAAR